MVLSSDAKVLFPALGSFEGKITNMGQNASVKHSCEYNLCTVQCSPRIMQSSLLWMSLLRPDLEDSC